MKSTNIFKKSIAFVASALILSTTVVPVFAETTDNVIVEQTEDGVSITDTTPTETSTTEDTTESETQETTTPETNNSEKQISNNTTKHFREISKVPQYVVGASTNKVSTGATVLGKTIVLDNNARNDNSGNYDIVDVVESNGDYITNAKAKVYKFASGTGSSYEGKTAKISMSCSNTTAEWVCTNVSSGVGTLTIKHTNGTGVTFYHGTYNSLNANSTHKKPHHSADNEWKTTDRTWNLWNGLRKGLVDNKTKWVNAIPPETVDKVIIQSGTTTINDYEFYGSRMNSIDWGSAKITSIGVGAFQNCHNLVGGDIDSYSEPFQFGEGIATAKFFFIPTTVKKLGHDCFRRCDALLGVGWADYDETAITEIPYNAFFNCIKLKCFVVPSSVTHIWGTRCDMDEAYGAFYMSPDSGETMATKLHIVLPDGDENKLVTIGDGAFRRKQGTSGSVVLKRKSEEVTGNIVIKFPKLTYMGKAAFAGNESFGGIMRFEQKLYVGSRAFENTKLTNIYSKYYSQIKGIKSAGFDKRPTSFIGFSNVFVGNHSRCFNNTTSPPSGYWSLKTIKDSVDSKWGADFSGILPFNESYSTWTQNGYLNYANDPVANTNATEISTEKHDWKWNEHIGGITEHPAPNTSYGNNNGKEKNDPYVRINASKTASTKSFLKTNVKWNTELTATETVDFSYMNGTIIDYVFVIDNSPSMDKAVKTADNADTEEKGNFFDGELAVSRKLNIYSQTYNIAKKALAQKKNTVSIITFTGNEKNELSKSSKTLGLRLTTASDVSKALFKNNDNQDYGGVTNYSAGLSRAYQEINTLRNKDSQGTHKQVVIMLTDGGPTYATPDGSEVMSANGTSAPQKQVNGRDWAKAIMGSPSTNYNVRNYTKSYYTSSSSNNTATQTVKGLGCNIYGILYGGNAQSLCAVTNIENKTDNATNVIKVTNSSLLAPRLVNMINSQYSENYTVVIPFDNNFELADGTKNSVQFFTGNSTSAGKTFATLSKTKNGTSTPIYGFFHGAGTYGSIAYDKTRNAIIWRLGPTPNINGQTEPYVNYKLKLTLKCVGNGAIRHDSSKNFLAVNSNTQLTSQNGSSTSLSGVGTKEISKTINANDEVTSYNVSGAYAFVSSNYNILNASKSATANTADNCIVNTTNAATQHNDVLNAENSGTLMNITHPIYLPTANLTVTKKDSDGNNLSGAAFNLFDKDGNLIKFSEVTSGSVKIYEYDMTGSIEDIPGTGAYTKSIRCLPVGTYYLYERVYPYNHTDDVNKNSIYDKVQTTITYNGVSKSVYAYKITVSQHSTDVLRAWVKVKPTDTQSTSSSGTITVYNMETREHNYITGNKRTFETGFGPLGGATFGLYYMNNSTKEFAATPAATTISANDGKFYFTMPMVGSIIRPGGYMIKEIAAPTGYTVEHSEYKFYVASYNTTDTKFAALKSEYDALDFNKVIRADTASTISTIQTTTWYDMPLADLRIHVNSSDKQKQNFKYQVYAYYTDSSNNKHYINGSSTTGYTDNAYQKPITSGDTNANGIIEINDLLMMYHIPGNWSGNSLFQLKYVIKQTTSPNDYYLWTEYGLSENSMTKKTEIETTLSKHGENTYTNVYVYNPAIKITVSNYDAADKTTPLSSNFALNRGTKTSTANVTGTTESTNITEELEFGLSLSSDKKTISTTSQSITPYDNITIKNIDTLGLYTVTYKVGSTTMTLPSGQTVAVIPSATNKTLMIQVKRTDGSTVDEQDISGIFESAVSVNSNTNQFMSSTWYGIDTITLAQTKVPEGYNLLKNTVSVPLTKSGTTNMSKKYNDEDNYYYEYHIRVYNVKQYDTVPTGGNGTNIPVYVLSGLVMLLMCLAGGVVLLRPRFDFSKLR